MTDSLHLSIDAADDTPGIALSPNGEFVATKIWRTESNHSVELLPSIDRVLSETGRTKFDLTAVFVDVGPGGYASLRVGVSIAKAIAHGLQIPLVAIGRLELDAYLVRDGARGRRLVAVHKSGRGELAWATYRDDDGWREESPPALMKAGALIDVLQPDDVLAGDISDDGDSSALGEHASVLRAAAHRVTSLADLGAQRLAAGRVDDHVAVVPLYLRAPAIGPQR